MVGKLLLGTTVLALARSSHKGGYNAFRPAAVQAVATAFAAASRAHVVALRWKEGMEDMLAEAQYIHRNGRLSRTAESGYDAGRQDDRVK